MDTVVKLQRKGTFAYILGLPGMARKLYPLFRKDCTRWVALRATWASLVMGVRLHFTIPEGHTPRSIEKDVNGKQYLRDHKGTLRGYIPAS